MDGEILFLTFRDCRHALFAYLFRPEGSQSTRVTLDGGQTCLTGCEFLVLDQDMRKASYCEEKYLFRRVLGVSYA